MDRIGIKKIVLDIEYYARREAVEADMGDWGDPDMWYFLGVQAMSQLIQKCRGNTRLAHKYLALYSI